MNAYTALLAETPVAFWLAAGALTAALAIALAIPRLLRAALAGPAAAAVALAAPRLPLAALAVFALVGALAGVWGLTLRRRAPAQTRPDRADAPPDDALLLGRVVRACAPFQGEIGRVTVDGRTRAARLAVHTAAPETDTPLRVMRVEGDALVVRPVEA